MYICPPSFPAAPIFRSSSGDPLGISSGQTTCKTDEQEVFLWQPSPDNQRTDYMDMQMNKSSPGNRKEGI